MDDPFGNMREQMERERDNFFKTVNPRDWPNDSSLRGGLFNRVSITETVLVIWVDNPNISPLLKAWRGSGWAGSVLYLRNVDRKVRVFWLGESTGWLGPVPHSHSTCFHSQHLHHARLTTWTFLSLSLNITPTDSLVRLNWSNVRYIVSSYSWP